MIKKEKNFNGNIEITYSNIPFVEHSNGHAKFVFKKKSNGEYYLLTPGPFLGHETPDIKEKMNELFALSCSIEQMENKLKTFVTWLVKEHPYSELKDVKDFNEYGKIKTHVGMYNKSGQKLFSTISTISKDDIEDVKRQLISRYVVAYEENVNPGDVVFKFRIYK